MKTIVLLLITLYRGFISPVLQTLFGKGCKYEISCSKYAQEVIIKQGMLKGLPLAFRRFLSCNNFGLNNNHGRFI